MKLAAFFVSFLLLTVSFVSGAEPVKVGIVWPLTGPISAVGSYLVGGVKLAQDKINSEGGILGRRVDLLFEDGANDPAQSVSAAEKLVARDKIDVFMGAWGSSPTLAVSATVTKKYGIPHMVETASSVKVTMQDGKRPNPWLFRISANNKMDAEGVEKFLVPKMGFTKVAFMAVNNDWGRGSTAEFSTVIKRSGGEVVAVEFLNQESTDFLTQLTKIRNTDANAIILTNDLAQAALVIKQHKQLGLKQKILTTGNVSPDGLVDLCGKEAAEGVYNILLFTPWFPELTKIPQETKWFVEEYLKRGNPFKGFGECHRGYDGLKAIKAAIELAGTTDKEAVRQAFAKVDIWGLAGRIKFDEFGQSTPSFNIIGIKDGKPYIPDFVRQ